MNIWDEYLMKAGELREDSRHIFVTTHRNVENQCRPHSCASSHCYSALPLQSFSFKS